MDMARPRPVLLAALPGTRKISNTYPKILLMLIPVSEIVNRTASGPPQPQRDTSSSVRVSQHYQHRSVLILASAATAGTRWHLHLDVDALVFARGRMASAAARAAIQASTEIECFSPSSRAKSGDC